MSVSVIIPAHNEAARIGPVVRAALQYADEVLVVDDGSADGTGTVAEMAGARVIRQANAGYIAAVKRGFREAQGEVVVTMDGDGEHRAKDIPRLVAPILSGEADLVLGARPHVARFSERFLNWLTRLRVKEISDTGTGFRALRRDLALRLELRGRCICGISILEPVALGARVVETPIALSRTDKPRRVAWFHLPQVWYVLRWLLQGSRGEREWKMEERRGEMRSDMAVVDVIYERVKSFPEARQKQVLDFVDYLLYKSGQEDRSWMEMSLRSALRGLEDEVWPDYGVEDLREQWI